MIPDSITIYAIFSIVIVMYVNYIYAIAMQISYYLNIPIFLIHAAPKAKRQ
jgi:hypothetical protein